MSNSPEKKAASINAIPEEFSHLHNYWVSGSIKNEIHITITKDLSKSVVTEKVSATGVIRKTYSNAPDKIEVEIKSTDTSDLTGRSNQYLFNSGYLKFDEVPLTFDVEKPFFKHLGNPWFANNVLPKSAGAYNTVTKTRAYSLPKDWKGVDIEGEDVYNEGATPTRIRPYKEYASIQLTTRTVAGSGQFSTNNPVWTGGITTRETTKPALIEVNELLEMMGGISKHQLQEMTHLITFIEKKDPEKFIVSTGCEIETTEKGYRGLVYYNGLNIQEKSPSGKMTSYMMQYPGVTCFWIFEAEGITGARGGRQIASFSSKLDNEIKIVKGKTISYNATTKTFTYDRPGRLKFVFEEGPAQGKNWGGEAYIELP